MPPHGRGVTCARFAPCFPLWALPHLRSLGSKLLREHPQIYLCVRIVTSPQSGTGSCRETVSNGEIAFLATQHKGYENRAWRPRKGAHTRAAPEVRLRSREPVFADAHTTGAVLLPTPPHACHVACIAKSRHGSGTRRIRPRGSVQHVAKKHPCATNCACCCPSEPRANILTAADSISQTRSGTFYAAQTCVIYANTAIRKLFLLKRALKLSQLPPSAFSQTKPTLYRP